MEAKMDTVMDVGQEDMKSYWDRMEAEIKTDQEEVKTAINSMLSELEETINRVEDVLASVPPRGTQRKDSRNVTRPTGSDEFSRHVDQEPP
jgi:hypothetical protein